MAQFAVVKDATRRSNRASPPTSVLTAAALQDHICRQLSLTTPLPVRPLQLPGCRRCSKLTSLEGRSLAPRGDHVCGDRRGRPARVGPSSEHGGGYRLATGKSSAPRSPRNGATVNGRRKEGEREEYVLDPQRPTLTLAQRLGLVEAPPQLLSEGEWEVTKSKSRVREDSSRPCPICQEDFDLREQALLSCSHVFHLACLRSFERFTHKKTCPLCRCHGYQSRVIFEGSQQYRLRCAIRIQAAWRGYVVRKWYRKLRQRVPPNDPKLRRKYFEEKLSALTDRMLHSCVCSATDTEDVLAQADRTVARSREAMKMFEAQSPLPSLSPSHWHSLRSKVTNQGTLPTTECPVCLSLLLPSPVTALHRPISLLSCGHLLHRTCIQSLEDHCMVGGAKLCPLCRAPYHRQPLLVNESLSCLQAV